MDPIAEPPDVLNPRVNSMVRSPNFCHPSAIKSGATSKSFFAVLRRTLKAMNNIVKPHPSFEVPRSHRSPRRPLVISPMEKVPTRPVERSWDFDNASILGSNNLNGDSAPLDTISMDSVPHIPSLDNQYCHGHGDVIGTADRVHILRRTKDNICSITCGHNVASPLSQQEPRHLTEDLTRSPPPQPEPKPLSPILEQEELPEPVTGPHSPNNSTDDLVLNSADSAIHFVDEDSGTVFSRVQHASGGCVVPEHFVLECSSIKSSLSLHIGSPPPCAAADLDAHIESLPSFVLTLPTPTSPHSPIFSPGVHFTTEKFINAAEAAALKDQAPMLPQCNHGQAGKLCRACEMQLLACRVWFQNADGGARAALREPFVRPAQSTVRTRAILASLGVGAQCPSGIGLGLANGSVRDDDDDPGSLAIETPRVRSKLVSLERAVSWSRVALGKLRVCLRALSPSSSTTSPINRRRNRKRRRA